MTEALEMVSIFLIENSCSLRTKEFGTGELVDRNSCDTLLNANRERYYYLDVAKIR